MLDYGDICAAARELSVPGPDLRRLIWAQPSLLENALEEHELAVQRAVGVLIEALDSPSDRRREWAAERILASYMARDQPIPRLPTWWWGRASGPTRYTVHGRLGSIVFIKRAVRCGPRHQRLSNRQRLHLAGSWQFDSDGSASGDVVGSTPVGCDQAAISTSLRQRRRVKEGLHRRSLPKHHLRP